GHDAKGRFTHGNKGGPGNPYARQVAALRKVILNRLTEQDLLAITEALLAKAKEGSVGAAKLLLAYALGKPASAPDPDRLDGRSGHDAKGRFTHGNKGGPGNPYARQVAALRKVILNRLTEQDLLAITEALLAKAKEGSVGAAKLLLAYALGKPASAPDPDRLDG